MAGITRPSKSSMARSGPSGLPVRPAEGRSACVQENGSTASATVRTTDELILECLMAGIMRLAYPEGQDSAGPLCSPSAQSFHRVDFGRPSSRQVTGERSDHYQHYRDDQERRRIMWAHLEQRSREHSAEESRSQQPYHHPANVMSKPCRSTIVRISSLRAPKATRTPISRDRRPTL